MANTLDPQYITNEAGEKTAVILSIEEFQELLEDLDDLATAADRRGEPTRSHEALVLSLKTDGFLSD
ncbi:MAG: hypothetical protein ACRERU_22015 [Methylococcales bacterium]